MIKSGHIERIRHNPIALFGASLLLGAVVLTAPADAQGRDPAYAAARAAGQVGEKTDGYLGYPVPPSPEVRRLAEDINIKRKALYADQAQAKGATTEDYAFAAGCIAISRTTPGEKYQAPDGSWRTRDGSPPLRDNRCP